jgi:hypothetical protein
MVPMAECLGEPAREDNYDGENQKLGKAWE